MVSASSVRPGPDQAGDAEDLAAPHRERHVVHACGAAADVPQLERDHRRARCGRLGNTADSSRPTISRISSRSVDRVRGRRVATVSPSRSTVTRSAIANTSSSRCEM